MSTPAGWYPNPDNPGQQRYWDGTSWTNNTSPGPGGEEPTIAFGAGQFPPPPPPPAGKPWYLRTWVMATAAVLALLVIIGAIGSAAEDKSEAEADRPAKPAETVTVTSEPTPSPSPTPTPQPAADPEPADPTTESQVGNNPEASGDTFIVPDEVGKNLQAAQDDLQAVTGNPLYFTDSKDATGDDRFQMWDANWIVCSQSHEPGTKLSTSNMDIVFYVVKDDETCP